MQNLVLQLILILADTTFNVRMDNHFTENVPQTYILTAKRLDVMTNNPELSVKIHLLLHHPHYYLLSQI